MVQETKTHIFSSSPPEQAGSALKTAQPIEPCFTHSQLALARQHLEKLHFRLPHFIDSSAFKELDRIGIMTEEDFIQKRSFYHLCQLAYSISYIRKKLFQEVALFPSQDIYDTRLMPTSLTFTFGSKPVLGILTHAHLKNKYEAFDEEYILLKIRKLISEAQLVKGSTYLLQFSHNTIKTLYFEIDKKSGLPFTPEEIKQLRLLLKQEIKFCIEQLVPRIFMTRNEEEVLKNILTLSREIHKTSDLPEVMILLDRQTSQEAIFTIILVRISKKQLTISEQFTHIQGNFTYFPERCQIVSYLEKKHPIEANVFRIHLPKDSSLLRADLSVNFYLARQKISSLLNQAIGDFRDFNGGIILKQREGFISFVEAFPDLSLQNPDLLENFFYSLVPIESQAALTSSSLITLFNLFIDAMGFDLTKPSDYFLKFDQNGNKFFVMIRLPDGDLKATLEQIFITLNLSQFQIVSSTLSLQNSVFLGYLISSPDLQDKLQQTISDTLIAWQQKIKSQKILKFGLEHRVVSLDPRVGGDHFSTLILKMLFEGLMRENREGKIEYGLAKSVEISPDLKTYLIKLHSTRWSDGSLVTAFDFEYAWKKVLSPTFKTPFAYLFYPIKNAALAKSGKVGSAAIGIHALDDKTLKVELQSPTPYFLELTSLTIYSPVHRLIDQLHPNWPLEEGSSYICNGAFQLIKNHPYEGYEMVKNAFYWDKDSIGLDQVSVFKMNHHQASERFQKNNSHWLGDPLSIWSFHFLPSENDEIVEFINKSVYWYSFNCEKPPFNHKKMRQAFSMAIDRVQLASLFCVRPIFSPLPLSHTLIDNSLLPDFNPLKAKILFDEALEEMGLSKGDFPPLTLAYLTGSIRNKLVDQIKQSWEGILGVQCIAQPLDWNVLFNKLTEGDYEVGCIAWLPWANDPMYTLNAFRDAKDPLNFPKWQNVQYQEILRLAEKEIDSQKRQNYYLQAEKLLVEESPVAPICQSPTQALKKKSLKIKSSSSVINFKWADFE